MTHSLTLGSLLLTDSMPDVDEDFSLSVLAEGAGFGAASSVQEIVTSLMADGDLARTRRYGNREVSFSVQITGPSLASLAQGEASLRREIGRPNLVTWAPSDGFASPTVFEVLTSEMSQKFDDLDELRNRRTFTVTLTCAPFARSLDLVTVPALDVPSGTTTVTVNNADSAAGWSAMIVAYEGLGDYSWLPTTVTDIGPGVAISPTGVSLSMACTLAAPVVLSGTPYLVVDLSGPPPSSFSVEVAVGGGVATRRVPVLLSRATTYPSVQYVLEVGDVTVRSLRMAWTTPDSTVNRHWPVNVYDVSATNALPVVTSRQATRTIATGGTERTPASIEVAPRVGGETLKLTIVHTSPLDGSGYSPSLRQWRVSGNSETTDAARISGAREPVLVNPVVAQMPLLSVPQGEYVLAALMKSSVAGTFPITYQARTFFAGSYLGGISETVSAKFSDAGFWTLVPLGVVTLPPVRAATNDAYVDLTINRSPVGAETIELDEWWAFRNGDGCALTMVASGNTSFLWLDSPDVSNSVPRIWTGVDGDRSDARHPGAALLAQGSHYLHPEGTAIFVASEGIQHAAVSATYHKRWHSNAAE